MADPLPPLKIRTVKDLTNSIEELIRVSLTDNDLAAQSEEFRAGYAKGMREALLTSLTARLKKRDANRVALQNLEGMIRAFDLSQAAIHVPVRPSALDVINAARLLLAGYHE